MTQSLSGRQWLAVLGLALISPIVVEVDKWIRRRRAVVPTLTDARSAVEPARAHRPAAELTTAGK
jgi:Ca2+-transporting ATPase